jgi:hypothetical protein
MFIILGCFFIKVILLLKLNYMKFLKNIFCITSLIIFSTSYAQVGLGTTSPDSSAVLEVYSATKGFLPPRHTTVSRDLIVNPANGLVIFNTTDNELQTNTGSPSNPIWTSSGIGPQGIPGINGTSAYEAWLNQGNTGTEAQFLSSLVGPQGTPGSDASVTGSSPINVTAGVVSINDMGITTNKLADYSVTGSKINPMGASNGQVLKWKALLGWQIPI